MEKDQPCNNEPKLPRGATNAQRTIRQWLSSGRLWSGQLYVLMRTMSSVQQRLRYWWPFVPHLHVDITGQRNNNPPCEWSLVSETDNRVNGLSAPGYKRTYAYMQLWETPVTWIFPALTYNMQSNTRSVAHWSLAQSVCD